jgi:hypothetical protein
MRQISQPQLQQIELHVFELFEVRKGSRRVKPKVDQPSLSFILPNSFMKRFAQQHATCTSGPSFPSHIPDATARHCNCQNGINITSLNPLTKPSDFMINVQEPIKRRMTKPPKTVLISGIPLCFAYRANSFTKTLAEIANKT